MRFYRALLHLFPRSFRAEYGGEMQKDFAREWESARGIAKLMLVMASVTSIVVNAFVVHLDILRQDLRYGIRSLRRTPAFTVTAIIVAALGIGATTATFSIADHVLLRPLPFKDADRLVKLSENHAAIGYPVMEPSPPNYQDWRRLATSSFVSIEGYGGSTSTLIGTGEPERVSGAIVAPGVFPLLGRQAALGRTLLESDATSTASPIVISDRLWRTRFAADPTVLGQTMTLDITTFVIVGVMPPDFFFPSATTDYWKITTFDGPADNSRGNNYMSVMARLKPGVSVAQAQAEMTNVAAQIAAQFPKEQTGKGVNVRGWRDDIGSQSRTMLWALVGAALCVLLIACTNLANLLMSRAIARRTEFALRAAIGASLDRLVRQMITDSVLLAAAGGILGVMLAVVAAPLVVRLVPFGLPIADVPPIDARMLAGAGFLTLLTGLAFGVLPAVRISHTADGAALKEGARSGSSRGTERLRSGLVVAEIVASVVLLVCAGLLIEALWRVQSTDPGFRSQNVLTLKTMLPRPKYAPPSSRAQFYRQVIAETRALPGVENAAYVSFTPFTMRGGMWEVLTTKPDATNLGGFEAPPDVKRAALRFVTPDYFATIGIPIKQGRDISETDGLETQPVAVVSESFGAEHFPGQDLIGREFGFAGAVRTIVGVVGDVRFRGLERTNSEPQVYLAAFQQASNSIATFYAPQDLIVRTTVPPSTLMPAVRAIIRKADPQLPITNMRTLDEVVSLETAPRVVQLRVLGGFAAIALILAAIGIHGLLAFNVTSRVREIGVRIALGAKASDIMWMVLGRSAALGIIGVTIGVVLAYAAGRSLQALLFGVNPANAVVFSFAVAVALLMTIAGSILPAWRAIKVDPITATRTD